VSLSSAGRKNFPRHSPKKGKYQGEKESVHRAEMRAEKRRAPTSPSWGEEKGFISPFSEAGGNQDAQGRKRLKNRTSATLNLRSGFEKRKDPSVYKKEKESGLSPAQKPVPAKKRKKDYDANGDSWCAGCASSGRKEVPVHNGSGGEGTF